MAKSGIREAEMFGRDKESIVPLAFVNHLFQPSTDALCRFAFPATYEVETGVKRISQTGTSRLRVVP